ncbi:MAG: hypothetical protein CV087_09735 [Candidatus Brocadia sp. WS118]|nr:MAG: hypothetical protein CV087_09735 [Candidatus Brocadia sp. WS118]
MIFGDRLVITKKGIYVNNETLATIGIQPEDKITLLPFRTFEYRKKEPGSQIRTDILITPISPEKWPFVIRFVLRLRNLPGTLYKVFEFLKEQNINILFEECSHSGHHHSVLNVLGEVKELEAITINKLIEKILDEGKRRKETLKEIYDLLYKDKKNFDDARKIINYYYEETPDASNENDDKGSAWFSRREPLSWSAFRKFEDYINQKDEGIKEIGEWDYDKIMKDVQSEVEKELKNRKDRKGIKYSETKKRLVNKLINEKVGIYLATKFKENTDCRLQEFLDQEIVETQPKIEVLEKNYHTNAETLYQRVEFQILPIKILLQAIIMYKRVMVERYKLLIIRDSLKDKSIEEKLQQKNNLENRKVEQIPEGVYLYNIRFYDMVIKYPYLMNERLMVYSIKESEEKSTESKKSEGMLDIFRDIVVRLDKLMQDRDKLGKIETRLDLDPVIITTVESLSHAAYHRAFMQHYICSTENAMIKFPENFNISSLFMGNTSESTTDDDYSTLAIGSRDTDSNSLRLSPIPLDSLSRFREIEFEYQRKCSNQCEAYGLREFQSATIQSESGHTEIYCKGTSMGIAHIFTKAIRQFESEDVRNPHYLNIWRIYNKTIEISKNYEAGCIIAIVQAVGDNFTGFTPNWGKNIEERLRIGINNEFPHRHVSFRRLSIRELSAGKVFVSLPFKHPRREEWMSKVIHIGKKAGFHEIYTIEEHTESVTKKVADYIKNSDAMIQIIAVQPNVKKESAEYTNKFIWLMAEYLAAISNGLEVVRLIDIDTIGDYEIKIGKDHPFLEFRIIDPSSEFDKVVEKAFKELRDKLGRKLGLS